MVFAVGIFPRGAVAAPDILPLSEVRPGMEGEALTVFQGTTPEPFKIRVVSIVRDFLPHQDVILVRGADPRVEHTGIAAGMSGSPVYIQGKLVGAIAYGFSFSKEPLAGVTPIEAMLAQRGRKGKPATDVYSLAGMAGTSAAERGFAPVSIPLSVSGISEAALRYLAEDLKTDHLVPMRAGGGGKVGDAKSALVPGAAVGVTLIRGDMSATAMGTLTVVDGNTVHAFGHPLFGAGVVNLPMVLGEVHTIIASLATSTKLASPLADVGRVTDDLKNGIVGVLHEQAGMIPLRIDFASEGTPLRPFAVEIARHRRMLPVFASAALATALGEAFPDVTDAVVDVVTTISLRGMDPISIRDQVAASDGFAPRILAMAHGPRVLGELLGNPFAPAIIDGIRMQVGLTYRADGVEIVSVASPGDKVLSGRALPLRVLLRPYNGKEYLETFAVELPPTLAGKMVKIEVASGSVTKPQIAKPEDLKGFVDTLRMFHPATSLVVSVGMGESGVQMRGTLVRGLPVSAMDTARPTRQTRRAEMFKVVGQTAFPVGKVVTGKQEITLQVLPAE